MGTNLKGLWEEAIVINNLWICPVCQHQWELNIKECSVCHYEKGDK